MSEAAITNIARAETYLRGINVSVNYSGRDGVTISGDMDLGNGYGLGIETGPTGVTGSLTILGSQQGSVDQTGAYTANQNFLGEISGEDVADLVKTVRQRDEADNPNQPAKSAKDAKDAKDADAAPTADDPEDGPSGLVDLVFAGTAVLITAGATFVAGGSSVPVGGSNGAGSGNSASGGNAGTVARPPRKEDGDTSNEPQVGHDNDDPSKGLTKNELSEYNALQDKLRNGEDLSPADAARHAQLDDIRKIQLYSDTISQNGETNGIRDKEKEMKEARAKRQKEQQKAMDKINELAKQNDNPNISESQRAKNDKEIERLQRDYQIGQHRLDKDGTYVDQPDFIHVSGGNSENKNIPPDPIDMKIVTKDGKGSGTGAENENGTKNNDNEKISTNSSDGKNDKSIQPNSAPVGVENARGIGKGEVISTSNGEIEIIWLGKEENAPTIHQDPKTGNTIIDTKGRKLQIKTKDGSIINGKGIMNIDDSIKKSREDNENNPNSIIEGLGTDKTKKRPNFGPVKPNPYHP